MSTWIARALVCAFVSSFVYWAAASAHFASARRHAAVLAEFEPRLLVRGAQVDLSVLGISPSGSNGLLLIVLSDECVYCQQEVPRWLGFIDQSQLVPRLPVAILSGRNHVLAQQVSSALTRAGIQSTIKILGKGDRTLLRAYMGISGTPTIALFDNRGVVHFVSARLNEQTLPVLRSEMAGITASVRSRR